MPEPIISLNKQHGSFAENITAITERLRLAEIKAGRNPFGVKLLAVSKTKSAEDIRDVFQLGISAFGENYLQEALDKISSLNSLDIEWHFIGPIQSNKTKAIAEHFDWVHTLSSEKVAQRLNNQRPNHLKPLNCCIQINIDDEPSKAGIPAKDLFALANGIKTLPHLCLRGLMCIPKHTENLAEQKISFTKMKTLFNDLQQQFQTVDTLSMGMSADLEQAVDCGSTLVSRIGTAIFGER